MTHASHPPEASASDALSELARSWRRYEGDFERAVREITEVGVHALRVARSSIWLLDDNRTELRCVDLYEDGRAGHTAGATLRASDFPAYFEALESEEPLAAHDAHTDPRTHEFAPSYLTPLGIGAMLDAPVRRGRRLVGVVCHEHVGGPRRWTLAEQKDAAFLASLASLALELSERARREALLTATLESTGEGILAADGERVVAFNRRFLQLWSLEAAELTSLANVRARMAAATESRFLAPPNDNTRRPSTASDSTDLVELADGRVLEWIARPQVLDEQVVGEVWSFRDVTSQRRVEAELRASEARMRDLAIRDGLTGLFNRRHALEQLAAALARSIIGGERLSVGLVDIDHFKRVNDELGHLTGDAVLRDFARVLTERVRASDVVGRYGGEEFVVVLRGANAVAGRAVLDQVRTALDLRLPGGGLPKYTFSAGVAELGTDGDDVTALLAAADERLYDAKRSGRARVY
jgi:diguanylate cyclase (GGDEF)-like protein